MYDRAARMLTRPVTNTAPTVGPGTYYSPTTPPAEGYAPFQSTSIRESFLTISEGVAAAPGPGHYSPTINSDGAKGGRPLHNKSNRFESSLSIAPGPGTYSVSEWPRRGKSFSLCRDTTRPSQIRFKRQNNAPSIPSSGFNNGYEEDSTGVLKPQVVPLADTTVGPAYYNPPLSETAALRKYKGIHFGNLTSDRVVFKGNEGPGPGDYSPTVCDRREDHTHTFIPTSIPRYHELVAKEENIKGVPGPGQYDLKSQFERKTVHKASTNSEHEKAPFGSCLQRFVNEKQTSPACTTYQDPRTALASIHRLHGMKRTPFGQSSTRFKVNKDNVALPGPGMYNDSYITGMTSQLMRKLMMAGFNQCPFGTTSSRTIPLTKKDESQMPGPAYYQDVRPKTNDRLSHTFASTTSRLYSPPADFPAPGSYDVSKAFVNTQGKVDASAVKTGFLSTLERFAPPRDIATEEPDECNPGPGEYGNDANGRKHMGGVIGCEKPRIKVPKSTTPGPGAYDLAKHQKDTVLHGTFNVTLVNPLKEKKGTSSRTQQAPTVLIGV